MLNIIRQNRIKISLFFILTGVFLSIFLCAQNWVTLALAGQLPDDRSYQELIEDLSYQYQVDPLVVRAIVRVESVDGKYLNRFEAKVFQTRKPDRSESEFDRKAMATSHGLMHVMGYNAKKCGLEWFELYDDKKNLFCGIKILKDCLKFAKNDVTRALGCYNGDLKVYPDKVKVALADMLLK